MREISLLGEQRLVGGAGGDAGTRSVALLAYLALHGGAPQTRRHLAGLFWPDSTEAQARTNLRRELHHLRAALADDPSLVVAQTTLSWRDRPSCRVDVRVFLTERQAALAAHADGDRSAFLKHVSAALTEYRGSLLPGMYEDWVLAHREELHRQCVELCDLAVAAWRESGDLRRAVDLARRRTQLEPLEEVGYRRLMDLQAETGNRAAALSTYHRCASLLEQELGIAPDPETTQAIDRLIGPRDDPTLKPAPGLSLSRSPTVGAELVGRGDEVSLLLQRWAEAIDGHGGLVLVSGEAGVGKSRLVLELVSAARERDAVVATTRCFGMSGRLALAPVADWLRTPDLEAAVATLDPVWQVEVGRLLPRGAGDPPAAAAGTRAMVDAWQRHRFFEGMARAVLAVGRPTLLVLDNLHWCDQETMSWLTFLLGISADAPLLVAVTVRSDELEHNPEISAEIASIRSAGLVTEIGLAPLNAAETAQLASLMLGHQVSGEDAKLLHAATGGYPLYTLEAVRSAPTSATPDESVPVADLTAVLRRRIAQASPAAREVAGLAASVGCDFSLDLLSEASDLDADTVVRAVDELWRHRILREQRTGYDFSHDLLRDAAYASVSPPRRWLLHRRLAQGLELLNAGHLDDVAALLAEQYDRGGRPDRAIYYFSRAAEVAAGLYANAEAIRYQRRRRALVRSMPAGRARDRRELEVLQAMSAPLNAVQGYSSSELQSVLERSAALAERLGQPHALLASLVGLFAVRFVQGHTALAHEFSARALELAESDPELAGQAHFAFAGSSTSLGRLAEAVTHFDLAYDLSLGAESLVVGTRPEVHAKAWCAHACWLLGDDNEAVGRADDAVARGRSVDHPYSLAVALAYAAITHQLRGDVAAMRLVAKELRALCRRYEFAYYGEWGLVLEGWATGGDSGVLQIRTGIARLRTHGAYARMPYWLSLLADSLVGCGRKRAARAVLDAALVAAEQRNDRWWQPEVLRLRAGLEHGPGAADLLRRGSALAAEQSSRVLESRCLSDLAARTVRDPVSGALAPDR
jgi:DNA-binding SARP family transcriptional activator/tetratricopeptide (TPR) repeat protein